MVWQEYNTVIFKLITEGWRRDGEAGDGGREVGGMWLSQVSEGKVPRVKARATGY